MASTTPPGWKGMPRHHPGHEYCIASKTAALQHDLLDTLPISSGYDMAVHSAPQENDEGTTA